jgi:hypothetical protein
LKDITWLFAPESHEKQSPRAYPLIRPNRAGIG